MKIIIFQVLFFFLSISALAQKWELINPPINKDFSNLTNIGDTIIVTTGGDIYISFNLGKIWETITPSSKIMGVNFTIRDIEVVNKRIYAYDRQNLIYSDDLGKTWLNKESLYAIYSLQFLNDNFMIATANYKVYLNDNSKFKKIGKNVGKALFAMGNKDKICILTEDNKAHLMVQNNEKWTEIEISDGLLLRNEKNEHIKPIDMIMTNKGDFLALYHFDKLYIYNQESKKWISFTENLTNINCASIANIAQKRNSIWVTTTQGGLYRTDDNGKTFSEKLNSSYALNRVNELVIGTNYIFVISDYGIIKGEIK